MKTMHAPNLCSKDNLKPETFEHETYQFLYLFPLNSECCRYFINALIFLLSTINRSYNVSKSSFETYFKSKALYNCDLVSPQDALAMDKY